MSLQTLLLAETDHRLLDRLPWILSLHVPQTTLDICTSVDELLHKLQDSAYATVVTSPAFIRKIRDSARPGNPPRLPPLILTVGQGDRMLAYEALQDDAFDLIVKPIVPDQAVHTVKAALAHNALRRVRASKERAASQLREHQAAYPFDVEAASRLRIRLAIFEKTLQALQMSFQLLLNITEEKSHFNMEPSVEELMKQRAFDRLLALYKVGLSH